MTTLEAQQTRDEAVANYRAACARIAEADQLDRQAAERRKAASALRVNAAETESRSHRAFDDDQAARLRDEHGRLRGLATGAENESRELAQRAAEMRRDAERQRDQAAALFDRANAGLLTAIAAEVTST